MRILLTNDDGIESAGLTLLAEALRNEGHRVFLVAPDKNRSGSSHYISFINDPCKLIEIEKDTWSCSGTPVDCVIVALLGGIAEICIIQDSEVDMSYAPDLILSGINIGANLGTDIVYSGTAAAARQGSLMGIPSIALSLVENRKNWFWEPVVSYIIEKLDNIKDLWKEGSFVNINFPNNGITPSSLVHAFPSKRYYSDHIVNYQSPDGSLFCFAKLGKAEKSPDTGSDWDEVRKNNAAYSLIISEPAAV
jgi:5'-nucleotidase